MTKSTGVGRGGHREGARRPELPKRLKREKQVISFRAGEFAYFVAAMGSVEAAKKQIEQWVQAYPIARGETDHLLAQSPLAARLLNYLEAIGTPESEDYAEELLSLIVAREWDEAKLVDGAIKLKGDSYII